VRGLQEKMMEEMWNFLSTMGIWLEGDGVDNISVQLPLGDTLEITNGVDSLEFRVKGRFQFLCELIPNLDVPDNKGYTFWLRMHLLRNVDVICRLNDREMALRNQAQAEALLFIGVLQKYDLQRPLYQRLTKDITKWIGRLFYDLALKRARESL
jgi:hypothetical protein